MMISPYSRHLVVGGGRSARTSLPFPACHLLPATCHSRRGITLTEILIAIMILGIGLVSLATLFPIGILRLRDATRYTRSATLLQTAAADAIARGMLDYGTFIYADGLNGLAGTPYWFRSSAGVLYNPMIQDTPYYGGDWGYYANTGLPVCAGANANPLVNLAGMTNFPAILASSPGLPFAYDPLWRFQTVGANGSGYYIGDTYEARFGYGLTTVRSDPDGNGPPSAHGLQRITNFNRPYFSSGKSEIPVMPASLFVPNVFVSQEDVVWQDPQSNVYGIDGQPPQYGGIPITGPSPVVPDLTLPTGVANGVLLNNNPGVATPSLDWRYSWMFTGQLTSAANLSCFDGNIVIFENRQFGIQPSIGPFNPGGNFSTQNYMVDGETVVEGVFGFSTQVIPPGGPSGGGGVGYGSAAERTVLLRWPAQLADPVVRPGDWIADVTYERNANTVVSRFYGYGNGNAFPYAGLQNWANSLEWDNLPAQRCYWYQVMKVGKVAPDLQLNGFRSVVVLVNQNLISRTVLNSNGTPAHLNAALIAPNVINVIPQTIFLRGNPNSGYGIP